MPFLGICESGSKPLDQFDEEAVGAFADDDGRAGVAALEEGFAGINLEAALVPAAAVAVDATGLRRWV